MHALFVYRSVSGRFYQHYFHTHQFEIVCTFAINIAYKLVCESFRRISFVVVYLCTIAIFIHFRSVWGSLYMRSLNTDQFNWGSLYMRSLDTISLRYMQFIYAFFVYKSVWSSLYMFSLYTDQFEVVYICSLWIQISLRYMQFIYALFVYRSVWSSL